MKHVAVMSFTAAIGLMAMFAVDFVDMIFISMLGDAALAAAVGYAGAILFFTTSFGIGFAIAGGALVARALGEDQDLLARERTVHTMVLGFILAVIFAFTIWINLAFLVELVGATGHTRDLAVGYLQIIIPTLPVLVVGIIGGAALRAHGNARSSMLSTIFSGTVNAALDPIFIFALGMGLNGAAFASVFARFTMAGYALWVLHRKHQGLARPNLRGVLRDVSPIMVLAFPAILTQLATPIGQAFVTRSMAQFGESAVSGMAVVGRLTPLAFAVVFALSGAVGPIIGQNFGAKNFDRVRKTFWDSILFVGICVVVVAIALFALRGPIADLFGVTGDGRALVYAFSGPLALVFFFNGLLFVGNASFNNLGHPYYSTWLNWGRHTVGTIPFVYIGAAWFGPVGVLAGPYVGGVVFGSLSIWLGLRVISQAAHDDAKMPSPEVNQARQMHLFHSRK